MEVSSTWILLGLLLDPDLSPVVDHKDSEGLHQMDYCEAVQYLIKESPNLDHYSRVLCWLQLELRKQLYLEELQRDQSSVMTIKHPPLSRASLGVFLTLLIDDFSLFSRFLGEDQWRSTQRL